MLNDLLIEMLGMQDYSITKAECKGDKVHLWLDLKEKVFRCPHCNQMTFSTHSHWKVTLKELPMLGYNTLLHIPHYRVYCTCQRKPIPVDIDIKEPGFQMTRRLARAIVKAAESVPLSFISDLYDIHWNTARDVDFNYLKNRIDMTSHLSPQFIGVDEVSYHKGHKYMTIVTDQKLRHVIFVTKGRKSSNLSEFFTTRMTSETRENLVAAAIDMWDPYEKSLKQHTPHAAVVYDKFHLLRMLNSCIDQTRRELQRQLEEKDRRLFKHTRFLLLKGQERLTPDQQQTLRELLNQNEPLQTAYLLKEQFRQLYTIEAEKDEPPDKVFKRAFAFLIGWLQRASACNLSSFRAFINRVKKRWYGILNYFRFRITNGLSEALNNKIASLQKRAYGYRNLEYFTLKIYQQGKFI